MNGRHRMCQFFVLALCLGGFHHLARAADALDELKVKRAEIFEFVSAPEVTRDGDRVTVVFESKAACDATVAVEDADGKIVRHLASGVLGENAPAPFQKGSLKQTVVWDGKDDTGKYVDDAESMFVRVSLGLKPQFERTLYWSPKKHAQADNEPMAQVCAATPEGVYVYHSANVDALRLFDHDGTYVRTVYPFPAAKVPAVQGLRTYAFPGDAEGAPALPLKTGYYQSTLLLGENMPLRVSRTTMSLRGTAMAVRDGRIALAGRFLARLGTDGSSGGMKLTGPDVSRVVHFSAYNNPYNVQPWSAAYSPDGKYLYLGAYGWHFFHSPWTGHGSLNGVLRMEAGSDKPPEVWLGTDKERATGEGEQAFDTAGGVAVDAQGRVYVCDHYKDRVQVFGADGKFIRSIGVPRPAMISVHPKTQALYVFTLTMLRDGMKEDRLQPKVTRFTALDDGAKKINALDLPLTAISSAWTCGMPGAWYRAELDPYVEPPTYWLSQVGFNGTNEKRNVLVVREKDNKIEIVRDFGKDVVAEVQRASTAPWVRQRLYVNPQNGKCYLAEADGGTGKSFGQLIELDAESGKQRIVDMPIDAQDICFDREGRIYLRADSLVARYEFRTWREVPWDYGEERGGVGFDKKRGELMSVLVAPGTRTNPFWHLGGMDVNARGHLVLHTYNGEKAKNRLGENANVAVPEGKRYSPSIFPGRMRGREIHVFDRHGQLVYDDLFPGVGHGNGIGIDEDDNLYMMVSARRLKDGGPLFPGLDDDLSETLVKARPKAAKVLSSGETFVPVKFAKEAWPARAPEIAGSASQGASGNAWIENAEWMYGGVGYAGMLAGWDSGGCCCWNARFDLDDFARSFAPELRRFSVAVLDRSGNLVTRVGRYGNADDGRPLVPEGGPAAAKSIGGDEVALFHAPFVATHTDKRLFIADPGNARVLSVKLGYHVEKRVSLKGEE